MNADLNICEVLPGTLKQEFSAIVDVQSPHCLEVEVVGLDIL